MIERYDLLTPFPTGAVVENIPVSGGAPAGFDVRCEGQTVTVRRALTPDEQIFGLGQAVGGIDKRGQKLRAWNSDDFSHTEHKECLYGSHNFLLFCRAEECVGLFLDDPGEIFYDLAFSRTDEAVIRAENGGMAFYVLRGDSPARICREMRRLTGSSYLPPFWGLGYIQSRWGYASEADVRAVTEGHREKDIPLDSVSMDIDYMDHYRDFTWNPEAFPDLAGFSAEMKADGIHLVPIIDAGVPADPSDPVYARGKAEDLYCKKADGSDFVAAVWPGRCVFPDFLREETRAWFAREYRPMLEAGMEGFWNDMNEPALFYTDEGIEAAYRVADELRGQNLPLEAHDRLKHAFTSLNNNREDYRRIHHLLNGKPVNHERVHNLYGWGLTEATAKAFRDWDPSRRKLLFSRSSMIGAHRCGGIWMGDNSSWWSHLLMNLKMLPNLNMCGFLFCGADLGGFSCDTSPELLLRWLQLGVFTPLMRNHSAHHTRMQEIYRFDNWEPMRRALRVRYALMPWLYAQLMRAGLTDGLLFRPLCFDYPQDAECRQVEDQLMLGEGAMIAPVCEPHARARHVYLPEDMLMLRFRDAEDFDAVPMTKGWHRVALAVDEFPLFLKKGVLLPMTAPANRSRDLDLRHYRLLGWTAGSAETPFYLDNGLTSSPSLAAGAACLKYASGQGCLEAPDGVYPADASGVLCGNP